MSSVEHGAPGNVLLEVLSRGVYDQDAWERTAAILSEITNHSAKENAPQLERATSSSLQRRGSNSAASLPDGLDNTNKHAGRIPHSAYMCTDARQTHINPLASQTQTLQKNEFLGPTQSPHSTHQQAVVARPNSSWNLHNAVADRKSVTDRKSVPDRLAQQPQQEQHSAARRSPQPSFNKLYNPKPQGAPPIVEPMAEGDWPAHIVVQCNGNLGKFMLGKQSMVCMCKLCQAKAAKADLPYTEMTPTEFERHSGMAASKKWKYTVRIQHDGRPIGTWLEMHGYAPKPILREKAATGDCRIATRDRSKVRDRSKSSDVSGEYSQGTTAHNRASALQRTQSVGQTAFAMAPVAALAAASSAALAPGPSARQHSMHSTIQDGTAFPAQHSMSRHATVSSAALAAAPSAPIASAAACDDAHVSATAAAFSAQQTDSTAAADLLIQAAAAASRAAASPEAEPDALAGTHNGAPGGAKGAMGVAGDPCDTSRAHPQADAAAAASQGQMADAGQGIKRTKRKAVAVRPQLRESAQHQAVIPDRVRHPPAPSHSPPRWDPGPSYEEALASASGPEKAAADLLPLDATFDPETHEGAALATQAGFPRNRRVLPDKRARRRPGWLHNTIHLRPAADPPAAELGGQSDEEANESGAANGMCSDQELRWPVTRRLRAFPARKRDRDDCNDDTNTAEESDWPHPGRSRKRARGPRDLDQQPSGFSAVVHTASNVPQRLRSLPRSNASTARAEMEAVATLGSMQPQVLLADDLPDGDLQVSIKYKGHTYAGLLSLLPEHDDDFTISSVGTCRHAGGAAGLEHVTASSEASRPRRRNSPHRRRSAAFCSDMEHLGMAGPSPPSLLAGQERGPHGPSRFCHQAHPFRRFDHSTTHQDVPSPDQTDMHSEAQVTPPARGLNQNNDREVQSSSKRHGNSAEPKSAEPGSVATSERRAAADREFARLEVEGAPEGTRCALCHGAEEEEGTATGQHSSQQDLGQLVVVKVSAVQIAWVHSQCAWWSPEVYESEGMLEGVPEAVRRGRMLKCKMCKHKGATLGCHVRNCRSSFHLPCARSARCRLQEDEHLATCPRHAPSAAEPARPAGPRTHNRATALFMTDAAQDNTSSSHSHSHRSLERSGSLCHWSSNNGDALQTQGRPLDPQELVDDEEGAEGLMRSASMLAWLRTFDENSFDPDAVPDIAMADYLGGTVSVAANRPGRCAVCVVQRKGKCGSLSAPNKCRRKLILAARHKMQQEEPEPWLPCPVRRRRT